MFSLERLLKKQKQRENKQHPQKILLSRYEIKIYFLKNAPLITSSSNEKYKKRNISVILFFFFFFTFCSNKNTNSSVDGKKSRGGELEGLKGGKREQNRVEKRE